MFGIIILIAMMVIAGVLLTPLVYRAEWKHDSPDDPHEYLLFLGYSPWIGIQITGSAPATFVFFGFHRELSEREDEEEPAELPAAEEKAGDDSKRQRKPLRKIKGILKILPIRETVALIRDLLKSLIYWGKPKQSDIDIRYGFVNPMYTGMVHGMWTASGVGHLLNGTVIPDFTQRDVTGSARVTGSGTLGGLLGRLFWIGLRLLHVLIRRQIDQLRQKVQRLVTS